MNYLFLIFAVAVAVLVYLLCRKLQKRVDDSSRLDELFNMKFVKGEDGVKTQHKDFYDALVKKFGKEYLIECNYNLKHVLKIDEDIFCDFALVKNGIRLSLVILLKDDNLIVEGCRKARKKVLTFTEDAVCDEFVLTVIEKKLKGNKKNENNSREV